MLESVANNFLKEAVLSTYKPLRSRVATKFASLACSDGNPYMLAPPTRRESMSKGIIYLANYTGETVSPVSRQAMSVTMSVAAQGAPRYSRVLCQSVHRDVGPGTDLVAGEVRADGLARTGAHVNVVGAGPNKVVVGMPEVVRHGVFVGGEVAAVGVDAEHGLALCLRASEHPLPEGARRKRRTGTPP